MQSPSSLPGAPGPGRGGSPPTSGEEERSKPPRGLPAGAVRELCVARKTKGRLEIAPGFFSGWGWEYGETSKNGTPHFFRI